MPTLDEACEDQSAAWQLLPRTSSGVHRQLPSLSRFRTTAKRRQCHGDAASGKPFAAGAACVDLARTSWTAKPVVLDEVRYEGNISAQWGQLSAESMAQRFWVFAAKAAYAGHSETVIPAVWEGLCGGNANDCMCSPDMWWNHGGGLAGGSSGFIAFFRSYVESLSPPFSALQSDTIVPGVFWLHDSASGNATNLVVWDETILDAPTAAVIPLPVGRAFALRQAVVNESRFIDLGTRVGPLSFTPPSPGFILDIRAVN